MRGLAALLLAVPATALQAPPAPPPVFKSQVELVYVNVVVRDKNGAPVRGLKREDFALLEDGKAQTITTFGFEEVATESAPAEPATVAAAPANAASVEAPRAQVPPAERPAASVETLAVLKPVPAGAPSAGAPLAGAPLAGAPSAGAPLDSALSGRRLVVLLFDGHGMGDDQVERALGSAREYVDKRMSAADLVAVAAVDGGLRVHQDFTSDRARLHAALDKVQGIESPSSPEAASETSDPDASDQAAAAVDMSEIELFEIDQRLRALEQLAQALSPLRQKKSVILFSGGMGGAGVENQVELRAAVDGAVRANLAVYPVDTRGLEALPPGGDGSQASSMSADAFLGRAVAGAFDQLVASQDTLAGLASGTGGKTFFDSNDFAGVFDRVIKDTSAYYVLGYASTNPRMDGKLRRIKVSLRGAGLKVEHRAGYYARKDFAHSNRNDRDREMREQLLTALSATDLPVCLRTAYFRAEEEDRFHVAVAIGVPGAAVPFAREGGDDRATLDLMGVLRDEGQRAIANIRDTIRVNAKASEDVRRKNVQYQTVLTVTPGHYRLKVVLRENRNGTIGSFETDLLVPDMRNAPVKLSSVVLGTQVQAIKGRSRNPLARDGSELVQSLTHVVSTARPLYLYYEVYDPKRPKDGGDARLRTSLTFMRGAVREYETPVVELSKLTAPERAAAVFQFSVPAGSLKPGFYFCQVNVIDAAKETFTFSRVPLLVR